MLKLTRKTGESVFLQLPSGEAIEVKVLSNRHGQVKLGFNAPKSVDIQRDNMKKPKKPE
jgi:carbon storage regulator CsrA